MVKMMKFTLSAMMAVALVAALGGPVAALELLMVEKPGCAWCQRWDDEIAPIYPRTDEGHHAPLYRANIHDLPRGVQFRTPIIFTPTFVLIDESREVGRITGYSGQDMFWGLLGELLGKQAPRGR